MCFKEFAEYFLKVNKNHYKPSSFDKVQGIINKRLSVFFNYELSEIKTSQIKSWIFSLNDIGLKSKKHYLSVLSVIFDFAIDDDLLTKNPVKSVKLPKYHKAKIKPFSADEVKAILEKSKKFNVKFQLFLKIGFYTGLRTGEILALKIKDINLKEKIISVNATRSRFGENSPKTHLSTRKVPILNALQKDLKAYLKAFNENFYLFETQYKKPYKDDFVFTRNFWRKILSELNLEYRRLYSMRHTFATNMLLGNHLSPVELSEILGHSSCEMVYKVYVQYTQSLNKDFKRNLNPYG